MVDTLGKRKHVDVYNYVIMHRRSPIILFNNYKQKYTMVQKESTLKETNATTALVNNLRLR